MRDESKCGYIFLYTLIKIACGVLGMLFMSFYALGSVPVAVLGGYTLAGVIVGEDQGGWGSKGYIAYMWLMAIFQMSWVLAAVDYGNRLDS